MTPFQRETLIHQHNKIEQAKKDEAEKRKKEAENSKNKKPKKARMRRGR